MGKREQNSQVLDTFNSAMFDNATVLMCVASLPPIQSLDLLRLLGSLTLALLSLFCVCPGPVLQDCQLRLALFEFFQLGLKVNE